MYRPIVATSVVLFVLALGYATGFARPGGTTDLDRAASRVAVLTSGGTATATGTAIPHVTPIPVTPTVPITVTAHPEYYPTTTAPWLPRTSFARSIAYVPGSFDVAFTVNRAYEEGTRGLFVARSDGSGELTGTTDPLLGTFEGIWGYLDVKASDDASKLAAGAAPADSSSDGEYKYADIWILNGDGSAAINLTEGAHRIADFGWVPGGDYIWLIDTSGVLLIRDISTHADTVLTNQLVRPSGTAGAALSWSPDGTKVVIGTFGAGQPLGTLDIYDRTTHGRSTITTFSAQTEPLPVYAPDGSTVYVFLSYDTPLGDTADLYQVAPLPNSPPALLTSLYNPSGRSYIGDVVVDPQLPNLYYIQDGRVRLTVSGSAPITVYDNPIEPAFRGLQLRETAGMKRLAFTTSQFHGAPAPSVNEQFYETTTFDIQSIVVP